MDSFRSTLAWVKSNREEAAHMYSELMEDYNRSLPVRRTTYGQGLGLRVLRHRPQMDTEFVASVSGSAGPFVQACVVAAFPVVALYFNLDSPRPEEIATVMCFNDLFQMSYGASMAPAPRDETEAMLMLRALFPPKILRLILSRVEFPASVTTHDDDVIFLEFT